MIDCPILFPPFLCKNKEEYNEKYKSSKRVASMLSWREVSSAITGQYVEGEWQVYDHKRYFA